MSLFHSPPPKKKQTKNTPPAKQAAQEGGQWVLRVEDVSHRGEEEDADGSERRARGLGSALSVASTAVMVASPADEELQAFLPLPTETVKLERA